MSHTEDCIVIAAVRNSELLSEAYRMEKLSARSGDSCPGNTITVGRGCLSHATGFHTDAWETGAWWLV